MISRNNFNFIISVCFLLIPYMSKAEIGCVGTKEIISNNKTESQVVQLTKQTIGQSLSIYRGDIDLIHFLVQEENNEFLLMITEGPSYKSGTVFKGSPLSDGQIKTTIVKENTVYSLYCR
ncbi:MAG: hypothetical protein KDD45_03990 [Bdellovibrionales bacterium]|nr:hypothetical protein [Bdellovibrionales bacterium]